VLLFMGGGINFLGFNLLGCFFCYWFIWVRGTLPRFRYDKLIYLAWKSFLPASLYFLFFFLTVTLFLI
jgi:NADH-ubiquinone oxidoreductase chain 1